MQIDRVIVLGAGAIGRSIALFISPHIKTILLTRTEEQAAHLNLGIRYRLKDDTEGHLKIEAVSRLDFPLDNTLLIVTTKAYSLEKALHSIKDKLTPSTYIICLQNGHGIEDLSRTVLPDMDERLQVGVASIGATIHNDGVLAYYGGGLRLKKAGLTEHFKEMLKDSSLKITLIEDINYEVWRKLLINCVVNPLSVLLEASNRMVAEEHLNPLKDAIMDEVKAIASFKGYELGTTAHDLNDYIRSDNRTSMLQDFYKGKRESEIDFLNGAICRLALKHGLETPVNNTIYWLVKGRFLLGRG